MRSNRNNRDARPQRPFRRLSIETNNNKTQSGGVSLCSFREEDEDVVGKDAPPKQPCCGSTIFESVSDTSATLREDDWDISSHGRYSSSPAFDYEQVKARERPNEKAPTIPITPDSPSLVQQRKAMVEEMWRCMNARDFQGMGRVCTDDFHVVFRGAQKKIVCTMTVEEIVAGSLQCCAALPDMKFMYRSIEESQTTPGVMILQDFVATGRHTGAPFAVGPPGLPPIQATGKLVVLDPCDQHYYFDHVTNKICREEEIAMGETTGIFGVYTLLSRP